MQAFLDETSRHFGFWYGICPQSEVAARMEAEGHAWAARCLTETEYAVWEGLRLPKRRAEWLSGRLAAKRAFAHYEESSDRLRSAVPYSVLNRPGGAPYIPEAPHLRVSISHSHTSTVAVVARAGIGIDLEKIEPRPAALLNFFFCAEEQDQIEKNCPLPSEKDALVTRCWTRKEAVSKYLQVGGRLVFSRINTIPDCIRLEAGFSFVCSLTEIRLLSETWQGYCLSLALPAG